MYKDKIKEIVKTILYLDSDEAFTDSDSLFTALGLSSIDFIDLCYELKEKINNSLTPETLWPFGKMLLDKKNYINDQWTTEGWNEAADVLGIPSSSEKLSTQQLYDYFSIDFINTRLKALS